MIVFPYCDIKHILSGHEILVINVAIIVLAL